MTNRHGEIKPRDFATAGGLFVLITFMGIFIISETFVDSNTYIDDEKLSNFNNTFNKVSDFQTTSSNLQGTVEGLDASSGGAFAFLNNLINKGWNALKNLFVQFQFLNDALKGLSEAFGVPLFIVDMFIAIVGIIFAFSILGVIFNRSV